MEFNVSNLSKTYKNNPVISVFTYQFRSGIYLLTGPNGKGKSTLLKLFSRIIRPSNRDYQMDYVRTCYLCEKIELLSYNSYSFLHAITKLNNIETDLKSLIDKWKIPKKDIMTLSKGNKQKVAILMTYLMDSDLYLFDEPTDSLDKEAISLFIEYIKYLEEQEKIIIITTHEKRYFSKLTYKEIKL